MNGMITAKQRYNDKDVTLFSCKKRTWGAEWLISFYASLIANKFTRFCGWWWYFIQSLLILDHKNATNWHMVQQGYTSCFTRHVSNFGAAVKSAFPKKTLNWQTINSEFICMVESAWGKQSKTVKIKNQRRTLSEKIRRKLDSPKMVKFLLPGYFPPS